jgi:hypothetical protein
MNYEIDLDPTHSVIRLTVMVETMTMELAEEIYRHLSEAAASGGPYAAIYDLSATKQTSMPTVQVRGFALRKPSIPMGRPHVVVGTGPVIFGLAHVFQMSGEAVGKRHQVVHSVDEAYEIVGAHPEDFTECLIWPCEWVSRQSLTLPRSPHWTRFELLRSKSPCDRTPQTIIPSI